MVRPSIENSYNELLLGANRATHTCHVMSGTGLTGSRSL